MIIKFPTRWKRGRRGRARELDYGKCQWIRGSPGKILRDGSREPGGFVVWHLGVAQPVTVGELTLPTLGAAAGFAEELADGRVKPYRPVSGVWSSLHWALLFMFGPANAGERDALIALAQVRGVLRIPQTVDGQGELFDM